MAMANIFKKDKDKHNQLVTSLQVGLWLSDGTLKPTDFSGPTPKIDTTLLDLFDLIFHGTVEDIHSDAQRLTDARFKYGFFIDPDAARMWNADHSDTVTIPVGDSMDDSIFLRLAISDALVEVDVDPKASGININLHRLVSGDYGKDSEETKGSEGTEETKEDKFKREHPDTWELMDDIRDQLSEVSEDTVPEAANILTGRDLPGAIIGFQNRSEDVDLNTTAYYDVNDSNELVIHTLKDYFQSLLPAGVEFTKAEVKDGNIIINDEYKLEGDKLVKTTPDTTLEEPEKLVTLFTKEEKDKIIKYFNEEYQQEYTETHNTPTETETYVRAITEL